MDDQAQAVEDVHARMMGVLEEEETRPDQEAIDPPDDAEETDTEPEEDEEEVEEEASEEITHNGETKLLTKSELKELAQQGFDYTQKTQAVAEERRAVLADRQILQTQLAIHTQLSDVVASVKGLDNQIAQYKQVNWSDLAEQDPVQYLKLNQTYRDLKEARDGLVQDYNQKANQLSHTMEQNKSELLQAESRLLAQKVPAFAGAKAAETKEQLKTYLSSEGFSQAEATSILDHRMIAVAWKAAQYDKLKSTKSEINKRVAVAPKIVKSSQTVNQKASDRSDLKAKLARSGNGDIAAKLIEAML